MKLDLISILTLTPADKALLAQIESDSQRLLLDNPEDGCMSDDELARRMMERDQREKALQTAREKRSREWQALVDS